MDSTRRLEREIRTVQRMIEIYCTAHHGQRGVACQSCARLGQYAAARIEKCPLRGAKHVCSACKIHCYGPAMREEIRIVMRFSGPRMILFHPFLAILHVMDGMKRP